MRQRTIKFEYELLDKQGAFKKRLFNVLSASVRYASLGRLKGSANITMRDDPAIDWINDIIRIKCTINGKEYPLGEYLISSTRKIISGKNIKRECQCYSKLLLLDDDKIENRHVCLAGTNVINEVRRLLGSLPQELADSPLTLQTSKEWDVGTPKLTIINDLLAIINWTSLRVNPLGKFTATPYILPSERSVDFNLIADRSSIILPDKSDDLDLFHVPNVVVLRTNSGEVNPPLTATYENNSNDSATSTTARGRRIVHFEEVNDVINQEQLNVQAKKRLYELTDVYNTVEMETAIQPEAFGYAKCIYLRAGTIDAKFIQSSCEIECKAGGTMRRTLRRAIRI